jgi:RNA polymerase sigma-70 factor, ECF subfamily
VNDPSDPATPISAPFKPTTCNPAQFGEKVTTIAMALEREQRRTANVSEAPLQREAKDLPEAEAVRLACKGDARAFERVYRLHCRKVYGLCLRMARNLTEAEDLTQEAFLHVFRKIHTFRGESAFSTWLYRVAVNVVLMNLRKKRKAEVSLEELNEPDEETGAPREIIAGSDLRLAGLIDRVNLQWAMDQLPPGCRTVFILHDIQGYEHKEIADILGCTVGNSKSQSHKARRRLRNILRRAQRSPVSRRPPPATESSLLSVPT